MAQLTKHFFGGRFDGNIHGEKEDSRPLWENPRRQLLDLEFRPQLNLFKRNTCKNFRPPSPRSVKKQVTEMPSGGKIERMRLRVWPQNDQGNFLKKEKE